MSKLSEYSKFDHLVVESDDDDDDDDDNQNDKRGTVQNVKAHESAPAAAPPPPSQTSTSPSTSAGAPVQSNTRKDDKTGRYVFSHGGRKVYEWEQTLDDVTIYIDTPFPNLSASDFLCNISPTHLQLGLRKHDRLFLDEDFGGKVDTTESSWYLDDGKVLTIVLIKAYRGATWENALRGREAAVDPFTKEQIQKEMMLERFQEENPGMDFRGADFSGSVPDPRTFMGGVKHN